MPDDIITRDSQGNLAVNTVSSTEANVSYNYDDCFTVDTNGRRALRVVGAGGGSGDQHNLGYYATLEALQEAHATAEAGDFAIVGATDTVWIWDTDTSAWVDSDTKGQVTSVNNKTGTVTLTASDVGALPDSTVIPAAINAKRVDENIPITTSPTVKFSTAPTKPNIPYTIANTSGPPKQKLIPRFKNSTTYFFILLASF